MFRLPFLSVLSWSTFKPCRIPILKACSRSYLCNKQVALSTCLYSLSHSGLNRILEFSNPLTPLQSAYNEIINLAQHYMSPFGLFSSSIKAVSGC